jgi:hypothetical protein
MADGHRFFGLHEMGSRPLPRLISAASSTASTAMAPAKAQAALVRGDTAGQGTGRSVSHVNRDQAASV